MKRRMLPLLTLLTLCWLGACTTPYAGRFDYDQGWRLAVVMRSGPAAARFADGLDCRVPGSPAGYAYVEYHSGLRQRHAMVTIPKSGDLRENQQIYVNIRDCQTAIVPLEHPRPY